MSELSLSLLGPVQIALDGELLGEFRTRKVQALLIYLAAERQAHRRDALLELLWPGLPEKSARSNLRQILYYLRRDLPDLCNETGQKAPLTIANRQEIRLNPLAPVSTDTAQVEALLNGVDAHEHLDLSLCDHCVVQLQAAVSHSRGDFLSGFYLDDSNTFEAWAQARREYFRRRLLDALSMLTMITMRAGNFAAAQAYAEKQLEMDNLREGAYRQLMEVLARSGRREQAAAVYDLCRRVLAEELGMAPAARTTAMHEEILSGESHSGRTSRHDVRGYELKEEIGEGAYGVIYRAIQPALRREVAVKVIHHRYADDAEFIRRFDAEAQTIARLEHPYIVPLYDYWRDPQGAYLVMRYMRGHSLLAQLEKGPLEPEQAVTIVEQVAAALATAHQHGVIHRDIKPANILMDGAGNVYVSDFGIAKDLDRGRRAALEGSAARTLDYVSPEQISGGAVTPQTDIYSLGAVIYEMLTGEKPFGDTPLPQLLYNQLHEPIPLVAATRPDVRPEVDVVIQRATAKAPAERYRSALEMSEALRNALHGGLPVADERAPLPSIQPLYNPFKGLQAFQEGDTDDFFGRDALVAQLVARMSLWTKRPEARVLALVGPSGSGKSSVVKAGLIPALREGALPGSEKWFIAEMSPGSDPLHELAQALWRIAVDPPPNLVDAMQRDSGGILRAIRRVLPVERGLPGRDAQLLLIIDQFEELFTLVEEPAERTFFMSSLLTALKAERSPLRLLITLRADFYDRPLQLAEWGVLLKENTELILPLNHVELTWAIREPAWRVGVRLEEGLDATILADVADQPGALPLLQYAMTELFEQREGRRLTRARYEQLGGVRGALARQAENLYGALDAAGQEITRELFLRLVTLGEGAEDTRRRVLRVELEGLYGESQEPGNGRSHVSEILDRFGAARFLTFDRDPLTRLPTVEVAHEALLREWPRLRRWLTDSRDDIRQQRLLAQATREWRAAGHDESYLLHDARLQQFAAWASDSRVALTDEERAYIDASVAAHEARRARQKERRERELQAAQALAETQQARADEQARAAQQLRRRAAALAGALVVAAILALWAVAASRQANDNAELAQDNAAEARANANAAATNAANSAANAALAQTREALEALQRAAAEEARATAEAAEAEADRERLLAEEQVRLATSRERALAALNMLDKDPELSILLALQAVEMAQTQAAEEALHQAVQQSHVRFAVPGAYGAAFHPDGAHVATVSGSELSTWALGDEQPVMTATLPSEIESVFYNLDGQTIATGQKDGRIFLLDAATGAERAVLAGHSGAVYHITFSPDGRQLASSGAEGVAILWDLVAGEAAFTFPGVYRWYSRLAFTPDGSQLLVPEIADGQAAASGVVNLWDTTSGALRATLSAHSIHGPFSKDGAYITTGGGLDIHIWDGHALLATGALEPVATLSGHTIPSYDGAFSPDGTTYASGSGDETVKLWDVRSGRELFSLGGHSGVTSVKSFSPDGRRLLTVGTDGARIWNVSAVGHEEVMTMEGPAGSGWTSLTLSPDGTILALGGDNGDAHIRDARSGALLAALRGHSKGIYGLAFSADGERLITGGREAKAVVWDVPASVEKGEGVPLLTLTGHEEGLAGGTHTGVLGLAFSPDGSRIATGGADGTVRLWDATSGEPIGLIDEYADGAGVWSVAFRPDGRQLAASFESDTVGGFVIVWRLEADELVEAYTITDIPYRTLAVRYTPDGSGLLTSGIGQTRLWNSESGSMARELPDRAAFATRIALDAEGQLLITSSGDGVLWLWEMADSRNLLAIPTQLSLIDVALSPAGDYLYISTRNGYALVYALDLDTLVDLAHSRLTRRLTVEECQQYLHADSCPES